MVWRKKERSNLKPTCSLPLDVMSLSPILPCESVVSLREAVPFGVQGQPMASRSSMAPKLVGQDWRTARITGLISVSWVV
jgi:hypothetical protein